MYCSVGCLRGCCFCRAFDSAICCTLHTISSGYWPLTTVAAELASVIAVFAVHAVLRFVGWQIRSILRPSAEVAPDMCIGVASLCTHLLVVARYVHGGAIPTRLSIQLPALAGLYAGFLHRRCPTKGSILGLCMCAAHNPVTCSNPSRKAPTKVANSDAILPRKSTTFPHSFVHATVKPPLFKNSIPI